jgi:hypothetical protein
VRKVTVRGSKSGYLLIVGDPEARDNSNQKMSISEAEAAILLMKLKQELNQ